MFKFPPLVAPTKVTVFPLLQKAELSSHARNISSSLTAAGLSNIVDTTGNTIGGWSLKRTKQARMAPASAPAFASPPLLLPLLHTSCAQASGRSWAGTAPSPQCAS